MTGMEGYACNFRQMTTKEKGLFATFTSPEPDYGRQFPLDNYMIRTHLVNDELIRNVTLVFSDSVSYADLERMVADDFLHNCIDSVYIDRGNADSAIDCFDDLEFVGINETFLPFGSGKSLTLELAHVTKRSK